MSDLVSILIMIPVAIAVFIAIVLSVPLMMRLFDFVEPFVVRHSDRTYPRE